MGIEKNENRKKGAGFRIKLAVKIGIVVVISMIVLLIVNAIIPQYYMDMIYDQIAERGKGGITEYQVYLEYTADGLEKVANVMSADESFVKSVKEKDKTVVEEYIDDSGLKNTANFVAIFDKNAKTLYNSSAADAEGLAAVKDALGGKTVSDYTTQLDTDMMQVVALPIKSGSEVTGVMLIGNDMTDLDRLDEVSSNNVYEYTIFSGNTRVATTLINEEGSRAMGTQITDGTYEKIQETKEMITVRNDLFGEPYISAYSPIEDNSGAVIGMIFSGTNITNDVKEINRLRLIGTLISLAVIVAALINILVFINKMVSEPIAKVTAAARRISEGNIGLGNSESLNLKVKTRDEIGELAASLEDISETLKLYIGEMGEILQEIAKGNLCTRPKHQYKGELVSMHDSLVHIVDKLNEAMSAIKVSAEEVSSGASQVSDGAQALSQGATEQASEIEQLSDLIKDITAQIANNAENATTVNNLVLDTTKIVDSSQNTMASLSTAMGEINDVTMQMEKVVKTIDNFAFQTNILALNATVEAARAGVHGKGFAVVAEEVRNLASKSATAAKETGELIASTVEIVEKGVGLTNETAEQFEKIVDLVDDVNVKIGNIADASNTQAAAASKIVVSVDEISRVIQTNSATAEESAAASEEMSGLAQSLENVVNRFKINDTTSPSGEYDTFDMQSGYDEPTDSDVSESDEKYF